jgi:hypothetical protein
MNPCTRTPHASSRPGRRAAVGLAVAVAFGVIAGQLTAQAGNPIGLPATIVGNDASWNNIKNTAGTTNNDPVGGSTNNSPGLGVNDANLISTSQSDAFDTGMTLWVNSDIYVAPPNPTITPNLVATDPALMSGLNVSVEYYALTSSPTLRMQAIFQNPSSSPVTVTATLATNLGSDAGTTIVGTSTGDTSFTPADRWIVTDDGNPTASDPAVTHFLSSADALQPSSVSNTVFQDADTQGVLANYALTVPGNSTRRLLFFVQLNPSSAAGLANADTFEEGLTSDSEALTGISESEQAQIVNFDLTPKVVVGPVRVIGTGIIQMGRVRATVQVNAHRLANGQTGGSLVYTEPRLRSIRGYQITGITREGNTVTITGNARVSGGTSPGGTFTAEIEDNGPSGDVFSISAGGINVGPVTLTRGDIRVLP